MICVNITGAHLGMVVTTALFFQPGCRSEARKDGICLNMPAHASCLPCAAGIVDLRGTPFALADKDYPVPVFHDGDGPTLRTSPDGKIIELTATYGELQPFPGPCV
jgi:hypothetical protein